MAKCPVCETVQDAGVFCVECGTATGTPGHGATAVARLADVEPTRHAPAAASPVAILSELEREADSAPRTPAPSGPATCRYCKNVQSAGAFCDQCGMRFHRPSFGAAQPSDGSKARCSQCGVPGMVGARCTGCGARIVALGP